MHFVSVSDCISWAYKIQTFQISGAKLPEDRFEISAKIANTVTREELRRMLQSLLADRFHLAVHHDSKSLDSYVLLPGKNPHLEPADEVAEASIDIQPRVFAFNNASIFDLAGFLAESFQAPVIDMTAINGSFNLRIDVTRYMIGDKPSIDGLPGEASIFFAAVQDQLGLKIEHRKLPVDVLVVDHIEKPSEN
jgi:uncharacterized protein (TIGR03435 family)